MSIPPVEEVTNPMHFYSLNEYFRNRDETRQDGKERNGKYFLEIRGKPGYSESVYITFEHDDTRLKKVKRMIHFIDDFPKTVSDPTTLQLIDEFNEPSSNKDEILDNIISKLSVKVVFPRGRIGGRTRRRIQTKKKKRKQHKKKYSIKKRK